MLTPLEKARLAYQPRFPALLKNGTPVESEKIHLSKEVEAVFPFTKGGKKRGFKEGKAESKVLRVGVLFSGGQAAGGHNVITGLFDTLTAFNKDSQLIGFLGGASGLINGKARLLDAEIIAPFRNQGGFNLLGSGRTKIETEEQFASVRRVVEEMNLDGLVIIGGDDSNTNAGYLAENFAKHQIDCTVIGVPKTIDGDLKTKEIEVSFGYDTAAKLYSELIGNLAVDILSAKKMWAFVKLMGRSASHITLECALSTHPNLTLISEVVREEGKTLDQLIKEIADLIEERAAAGKPYGLILIPEGIVEFVREFKLPESVLADLDPHGNLQISKIETERLFITLVKDELEKRGKNIPFNPQPFFFGYEGRAGLPTNFDANYCYALGKLAALGVIHRAQGSIVALSDLHLPPEKWVPHLLPLVSLMGFETRKGKQAAVISKALVDLKGTLYKKFVQESTRWRLQDDYLSPGPIQFFGPEELTDVPCWALKER